VQCFTRNTLRDIAWEYEIITRIMARAKKPSIYDRPEFSTHSFSLTPDVLDALRRLSSEASDFLGWPVSNSAIVRALVRQVDQHGSPAAEALFLQVEKELKSGVKWGKQT
jgi:hypothetical protein